MKKFLFGLIVVISLLFPGSCIYAGRGGSSFAGGLAGGMIGGMVSGAMNRQSSKSGRRAEEKVDRLERERQQERMVDLRDEFRRQRSGFTMNVMFFAIILLFLAVIGLAVFILKGKRKR